MRQRIWSWLSSLIAIVFCGFENTKQPQTRKHHSARPSAATCTAAATVATAVDAVPSPGPVNGLASVGPATSEDAGILISCMALRPKDLEAIWPAPRPKLIEWPGQVPPGGGFPAWDIPALALRDREGRLLPALLRHYGIDANRTRKIGVIGFSAGANNGLRNLLRHPADRALVSAVISLDGLHPANASRTVWTADPKSHYLDWQGQMEPLAEMAIMAARGQGICIISATDVPRPHPSVSKTADALIDLVAHLQAQSSLPPAIPLRFAEVRPLPLRHAGAGNFVALWYAGHQAQDHITQARQIGPAILKTWLIPLWTQKK